MEEFNICRYFITSMKLPWLVENINFFPRKSHTLQKKKKPGKVKDKLLLMCR